MPIKAAADEPPPCALLDRADGVSRAGAAIGWSFLDDSPEVDFTGLRLDVHGQWVAPHLGVGGYAVLPLSYGRIDPDVGANNAEWSLGDAEVGGVYRRALIPELDLAAHIGVTLPTAPQSTFSADDRTGFANSFAIWARPNDLAQAYEEATFIRAGISPIHMAEKWFARGDIAVDVPVHSGAGNDLTTLGRLNGAIGARFDRGAAMLELVNLIALEKPENEAADRLLTFVGLTGVFGLGGPWSVVPSLMIPLDDEINDSVDMAFLLGVEAALP